MTPPAASAAPAAAPPGLPPSHSACNDPFGVGFPPIHTAAARGAWQAYVRALVRHFRGRVTHYEVWNEPDLTSFWKCGPRAADYVDDRGYPRFHGQEVPSAKGLFFIGFRNPLTGALLRVANSPVFRPRSAPRSALEAINMLGRTRTMATAASTALRSQCSGLDAAAVEALWSASARAAELSYAASRHTPCKALADAAYLAALMLYACADAYLRHGGRLGFVITQTLFQTRGAGDGFHREAAALASWLAQR